jgi:hypothetical protein
MAHAYCCALVIHTPGDLRQCTGINSWHFPDVSSDTINLLRPR